MFISQFSLVRGTSKLQILSAFPQLLNHLRECCRLELSFSDRSFCHVGAMTRGFKMFDRLLPRLFGLVQDLLDLVQSCLIFDQVIRALYQLVRKFALYTVLLAVSILTVQVGAAP